MVDQSRAVRDVYERIAPDARARLFAIRAMIYDLGERLDVGPISEELKWGQPSYLTRKAGTTVRLWADGTDDVTVFVPCQTDLLDRFRMQDPQGVKLDGNRAVHVPADVSLDVLVPFLSMALTYHRDKQG